MTPAGIPKKGKDYSVFDRMDTSALIAMIQADFQSPGEDGLDADAVLYITKLLTERRGKTPTDIDAAAAWAEFDALYRPLCDNDSSLYDDEDNADSSPVRAKPKRRRIRWVGAVAAAMCVFLLVGTAAASAFGYDVLGAVTQWTSEIFQFVHSHNDAEWDDSSLEAALAVYDLPPDGLVPTWIPEGYTLESVQVGDSPLMATILGDYYSADGHIQIELRYLRGDTASTYEKDDSLVEVYQIEDTDFYIYSNNMQNVVTWNYNGCDCSITGDLTIDDLYKMIDSIYGV